MVAYALRRLGHLPKRSQNCWLALAIATSIQLGLTCPSLWPTSGQSTTASTNATTMVHRAGDGAHGWLWRLPSETAGVLHPTSCRLAWQAPVIIMEPHSTARTSLARLLRTVRTLISLCEKFSSCLTHSSCPCLPLFEISPSIPRRVNHTVVKAHYGCKPLKRRESDLMGTIDNKANVRLAWMGSLCS
jgi:hypothetical protein